MSREVRVSVTKVTIEYYEVDMQYEGPRDNLLDNPLVDHAAKAYIRDDPSRYMLNQQDVLWGITNVKEL